MKKKALYIAELDTNETKNGGAAGERNHYLLLKELFELEETKVYVSDRSKIKTILSLLSSPIPIYYDRKQVRAICEQIDNTDAEYVFIENSNLGYFAKHSKARGKKVFVFFHNCEIQFARECRSRLWLRSVYKNERDALKYSNLSFILNERDYRDIKTNYPDIRFCHAYLPPFREDKLVPETKLSMQNTNRGNHLVFVGSYFKPNVEAVEYINNVIAPACPNAVFDIYGFQMERVELDWAPNVINHGTAINAGDCFANADAMIFPIFTGSGMKIKTEESLMYGKIIIGSPESLEGYRITDGDIYLCETLEQYAGAISAVCNNGKRFSEPNRHIWERDHSFSSARGKLISALEAYL